jgi:hypothetical protein
MLLALLVAVIPISSYAGVFISVGFAPPVLPVYEQPICPEPGLMWTPGYWAYGPDGYYWVPGAWVPPPYEGALWTPGYWGWGGGLYAWHPGYWGSQVGYYGGVNYGFGYMGVGFAGGMWRGGVFAYNRAVMHVGYGGGWGGNRVYSDRSIVERNTIVNNHVAYNGGPGGIRHEPTSQERMADHEQHTARTSFQTQHANEAMHNRAAYFNNNHGRPATLATARPLGREAHAAPESRGGQNPMYEGRGNNAARPANRPNNGEEMRGGAQNHAAPESHAVPEHRAAPEQHAAPQYHAAPESHAAPERRAAPEQRAAPERRAEPEHRAAPEQHAAPRPEARAPEHRAPEGHASEGHGGGHEDHGHQR